VAEPLLELAGVSKRFGGVSALRTVDLRVHRGEIASVIGPNGAGKTTLFNVITGAFAPDSGSIHLEGHPIAGLPPHQIVRRGLTRTFQNIRLFHSMTVREHLAVARGAQRRHAAQSAPEALLARLGLEGLAGRRAAELSYGEQRRVEIGRALACGPQLLLLDEPVAGMSRPESDALALLLRQLRDEGLSILLIEHDMRFVMGLCDRVSVLDFGTLIASGPPAQVQADARVLAAYLGGEATDAAG
jgi:ABC-type branched-subunit amino acid transport system ATPase component